MPLIQVQRRGQGLTTAELLIMAGKHFFGKLVFPIALCFDMGIDSVLLATVMHYLYQLFNITTAQLSVTSSICLVF
jgi:hypothetical protein